MSRRKFIAICMEEGLNRDLARQLYTHFKSKKPSLLIDTEGTEDWVRVSASTASAVYKQKN